MPFVQVDNSAAEAVLVGYYMWRDYDKEAGLAYANLAKSGIHDWLGCSWLGWEWTPANKALFKKKHDELRRQMKITVHGTGFGMTAFLMNKNDPDNFPTVAAAKRLQRFMFQKLPALAPWQQVERERGQKEGKLTNAWGLDHEFYDVFTFYLNDDGDRVMDDVTGMWKIKNGKDGNRVIAFLPQSSNGAFQRDNINLLRVSVVGEPPITDLEHMRRDWTALRRAARRGETWQRYFPANYSVHDSLALDVPWHMAEEAANSVMRIMTRPVPQLDNWSIGAEVEIGDDWLKMKSPVSWPMMTVDTPPAFPIDWWKE